MTLITVLAGQRRRGAGTALHQAISVWASERGAREMEVPVSGNDPQSLSELHTSRVAGCTAP